MMWRHSFTIRARIRAYDDSKENRMSLHHAESGEIIDIRPLGNKLGETASIALFKTAQLEAMRLVLAGGKEIQEHQVGGDFTLQCLEGVAELRAHGRTQILHAGEMVFVSANVPYSICAVQDASLLMTLARNPSGEGSPIL